ncbi:MAG: toll/interleukin-1 receptor domain-containing protein [Anaerolineales bacterium]|nr:toll/interleukin-1 receptor domain-containing protein [Anaerolineales bacterium]
MPTTDRKLSVFLCYASQDKAVVRELYQRLNAEGWIDPWLDEKKLLPGQDWNMEIEKAVEAADVVIVCLSKGSLTKEGYVQKELRFVLNIAGEKPEGTIFIIPLRADDCILPRSLRNFHYIDFFPKIKRNSGYARLLESLQLKSKSLSSFDVDDLGQENIKNNMDKIENPKVNEFFNIATTNLELLADIMINVYTTHDEFYELAKKNYLKLKSLGKPKSSNIKRGLSILDKTGNELRSLTIKLEKQISLLSKSTSAYYQSILPAIEDWPVDAANAVIILWVVNTIEKGLPLMKTREEIIKKSKNDLNSWENGTPIMSTAADEAIRIMGELSSELENTRRVHEQVRENLKQKLGFAKM